MFYSLGVESSKKVIANETLRVEQIDGRTVVIDAGLVDRRFVCYHTDGRVIGWLLDGSRMLLFLANVDESGDGIERVLAEKTQVGDTVIVDRLAGWEWDSRLAIGTTGGRCGVWKLG